MAVNLTDWTEPGTARLCVGFASAETGARKANVFYKYVLTGQGLM
jgi:hypothetical protein